MKSNTILLAAAGIAALAATALAQTGAPSPTMAKPTASCMSLASAALEGGAEITRVESVSAGQLSLPGPGGQSRNVTVPAFCRIAATLRPTADSDIKIEVWLPNGWNGKLYGVGNGGWAGSVGIDALAGNVAKGYATVSTDSGHTGGSGSFALGHPEKLTDFGWRAIHLMTVNAKKLTAAYYGSTPKYSYFNACSGGGRQALMAAQRFPNDFDGIVAGAPAINWSRLAAASIWSEQANLANGKPVIDRPQFALMKKAAIAQCDALDGVKDGEIADPRKCNFKPAGLACKAGTPAAECLSPEQVKVANHIYSASRNTKTGEFLFPAPPPGSEEGWPMTTTTELALGIDNYKYAYKADAKWDFKTLDWTKDVYGAERATKEVNAVNPDLSAFKARGGKLIHYHGWADFLIAPESSVNYYESVVAKQGGIDKTRDFYRLFMVPQMDHCAGGYAADFQAVIEAWVEKKTAPDSIVAQRFGPGPLAFGGGGGGAARTAVGARPLCAYPNAIAYDGKGDINAAASFKCTPGIRGSRKGQGPAKLGGAISSI